MDPRCAQPGIEAIFQDLAFANAQPVYMNMFLGRELVKGPLRRLDREAMAAQTQTLLDELDVRIDSPGRHPSHVGDDRRRGSGLGLTGGCPDRNAIKPAAPVAHNGAGVAQSRGKIAFTRGSAARWAERCRKARSARSESSSADRRALTAPRARRD